MVSSMPDRPGSDESTADGSDGSRTPTLGADESSTASWRIGLLGELHAMLLATVPIDALLAAIAGRAAARAGEDVSAAITLRLGGQGIVAAATDARSEACDRAEQTAGEGPCLAAAGALHPIVVPDVAADDRWPRWRQATLGAGFGSAVALPASNPVGPDLDLAITLYRPLADDWDDGVLGDVLRYAEDAARAVAVAARAGEQVRVNADLKQAMASRAVIDQALGVIMAQNRCGPEEAFAILRQASQHRNAKLRHVAATIVARVSGTTPHSPNEFRDRPLS